MQKLNPWNGVDHYENFPVASRLVPSAVRPAVVALYHFARFADDLADEGELSAETRLAGLSLLRESLEGGPEAAQHAPPVVQSLWTHIDRHGLSIELLLDLLSAFEQDVRGVVYHTRDQVLDYCRRSANPVGRLLLQLFRVEPDPETLAHSDSICTALQLINFIQDLGIDLSRGRCYLPREQLATEGLDRDALRAALAAGVSSPELRRVIAGETQWARSLLRHGTPLVRAVPWRLGLELRAIIAGGSRIIEQIEIGGFDPIGCRPRLAARDAPALVRLFLGVGR